MLRQFHDTNVNILRPGMNGKVKQDLTQNQDRYFVFFEKCLMENHGYRRLKDRYKKREMTVEREAEAEYEKRVCKSGVSDAEN